MSFREIFFSFRTFVRKMFVRGEFSRGKFSREKFSHGEFSWGSSFGRSFFFENCRYSPFCISFHFNNKTTMSFNFPLKKKKKSTLILSLFKCYLLENTKLTKFLTIFGFNTDSTI